MLFNSAEYMGFLLAAGAVYYIIPRRIRYIWLLFASYFFYMCWGSKYALLLFACTLVSYGAALLMEKFEGRRARKAVLAAGVIINAGLLILFKYTAFLLENLNKVLSIGGGDGINYVWSLALPVGISFYIFKAIAYMADVYRGKYTAEKNFVAYALYVSYFPQLAAGPIDRPQNLLEQIKGLPDAKRFDWDKITRGLTVLLWGAFIKMVIADRIALFVNTVFDQYFLYGTTELILGAIGYAIQIYGDFAGYSLMSIGSAMALGFDVPDNFDTPYLAVSNRDFWRRWHISLSSWFRDYVYIPLGGSRCSKARKRFNIFATMAVSGLWHGAAWTYIIWGMLHGLYQVLEDMFSGRLHDLWVRLNVRTESVSYKIGQMLITFAAADLAWIFFRAPSATDALLYIQRMFTKYDPWVIWDGSLAKLGLSALEFNILMAAIIVMVIVDLVQYIFHLRIDQALAKECLWFRWLVLISLLSAVWIFGIYGPGFSGSQFIYLKF